MLTLGMRVDYFVMEVGVARRINCESAQFQEKGL